MTSYDAATDGRPSTTLQDNNQKSSKRLVTCCILLMLAVSSLLIVACGGDDDEADAGQESTAGVAAVSTPTVEIAPTPTAIPESTETATAEPAAATATPDSTDGGPSIRVSPESGSRDEPFLFITSGLTPDHVYELVIRDPDGEEFVEEAVFDENSMELVAVSGPFEGEALSIWYVEPNDPLGEHTVELRDIDTGSVLASDSFTVE